MIKKKTVPQQSPEHPTNDDWNGASLKNFPRAVYAASIKAMEPLPITSFFGGIFTSGSTCLINAPEEFREFIYLAATAIADGITFLGFATENGPRVAYYAPLLSTHASKSFIETAENNLGEEPSKRIRLITNQLGKCFFFPLTTEKGREQFDCAVNGRSEFYFVDISGIPSSDFLDLIKTSAFGGWLMGHKLDGKTIVFITPKRLPKGNYGDSLFDTVINVKPNKKTISYGITAYDIAWERPPQALPDTILPIAVVRKVQTDGDAIWNHTAEFKIDESKSRAAVCSATNPSATNAEKYSATKPVRKLSHQ